MKTFVQHGGGEALVIHVHIGKDIGHCQRMGDIGFTAATCLASVGLLGIKIGAADHINLVRVEISA